jgi:thymidine kinase
MAGRITLVLGSMMAGKTGFLVSVIRRHISVGMGVYAINHSLDTRYGKNSLCTHDGQAIPCVMTDRLVPLLDSAEYRRSQVVVVEELQFFEPKDARDFCELAATRDGKRVYAAGLQGDRHRGAWPTITALIPLADDIQHLTGMCSLCADGTPGAFTKRKPAFETEANLVGNSKEYWCLCRSCYAARSAPGPATPAGPA